MGRLDRLGPLLLWPGLPLLYLLLPGHPLGVFTGLPLGMGAVGLALLLGLAAWVGARPSPSLARPLALALAVACGLKLALAALALPYGLTAVYVAGTDLTQPPERSTEARLDGATRVEQSLDLVGDRFPVHFFNDLRRFNFYTPSQPRRDLLPFAATWRGWLTEPAGWLLDPGDLGGSYWITEPPEPTTCFRLQANGSASLRLGDEAPISIGPVGRVETREFCVWHKANTAPVELKYVRPQEGVPFLRFEEKSVDGRLMTIGLERWLRTDASRETILRDRWLAVTSRGLDASVLGLSLLVLAGTVLRGLGRASRPAACPWDRLVISLGLLAAFAEALAVHGHFAGRAAILSGGNDWLAYGSYARDALLNGPLVSGGKPLGEGETFYYQPLYIYYLAGLHLLLGESLYGVLVAQYVAVAVAGVLTFFLTRELFGPAAAWVAFGLAWAFRYLFFNQTAGLLLSENLVSLLIPPLLLLLARWHRTWRRADLVGGGLLLGLAILTRSTPLLFLPPSMLLVGLAVWRKLGDRRAAVGTATLLLIVTLAVTSLVGVRNVLVAGRPALLPESTSANLWEAHRPSARVNLARIDRDPLYNRLNLDRQTREVLEFARQDPLGYGWSLAVMGLYALGLTGPALGTSQVQWELILLTALYLGGLLFVRRARAGPAWFVHFFVATHFFQMMIFMSHQYGFRLPLPMYGPMLAVAGATVVAIGRLLMWQRAVPAPALRWSAAVAVLLAVGWTGFQLTRPRNPEAGVFGLGGDAAATARAVAAADQAWLADRLYFAGRDGRSFNVAYLPGLAYREMKWLSPQSFVWPPDGKQGLLAWPSDGVGPRAACGDGRPSGSELLDSVGTVGPGAASLFLLRDDPVCRAAGRRLASFGGLIDLHAAQAAGALDGSEVTLAWRVIQRPSFRARLVLELLDRDNVVRASALHDPYPSGSWEPGEVIVTRLPTPVATAAWSGDARLAVAFTRGSPDTRLPIDDPLPLYGQTRLVLHE